MSDPYRRIGEQEQEIRRLWRKIDAGPARTWLETDDPDVVACMGSAPACARNGCQLVKAEQTIAALLAALKALRESHTECVTFEREGGDNTDIETVEGRCEACRVADAAIANAEPPAPVDTKEPQA